MEGDYDSPGQSKSPISTYRCSGGRVWISPFGAASIRVIDKMQKRKRKIDEIENDFKDYGILEDDECIQGIMEEVSFTDTMKDLLEYMQEELNHMQIVPVNSVEMYVQIQEFYEGVVRNDVNVNTKYKTVDKKVKPVAVPLPKGSMERVKEAATEPMLRRNDKVGHTFTKDTKDKLQIGGGGFLLPEEEKCFERMLEKHGKAFAFSPSEIGCVDPGIVEPMVIFTVPHVPWNIKPIPVPRAHIPKLIDLLKEKVEMGILEPSNAPYSNRWFTVPKKNGKLRFIQDLQPVNKVTIRNSGIGPIVDEYAEAFAGRAIYSMGDLYSGYDQFQLALESRDITTMRTPIGLVRMCTLPQGATNSVAHMMNAMNKVLSDYVPSITMPFLDDIPIKGCAEEEKDKTIGQDGCRNFVANHISDCEKILKRLEDVHLTLSGEKSVFGKPEVLIVGHMCGSYGRRPSPAKVDAIQEMKEICNSPREVRRFLGACVFYHIWIPHFAHVSEPLYRLLRKGQKFEWKEEHTEAMQRLKRLLLEAPALRKACYDEGNAIYVTVDTSPTGIGWVISQEDKDGSRYAIRFGAKVLSGTQRKYPQVKRELWGVVSAIKTDRDYLIGAEVVVETDCLPILGMITGCSTPDIAMLRWIAYIKSLNPEIQHIAGQRNSVADMLSRARYWDEEKMVEEDEGIGMNFFTVNVIESENDPCFNDEEYEGELKKIGLFLKNLRKDDAWSRDEFKKIRKKAYKFFLKDGYLWRHPKRIEEAPTRVVGDEEQKAKIMREFHDSRWAGHRGVWATFSKIKDRYWWPSLYKDVAQYVETCITCQKYTGIRHRDELHPTYSPGIHFKWMVDLVVMPMGVGQMKYLALAREDLTNQVEGRALRSKGTGLVCRFLLEDVICRYGCVGQIVADRGELDSDEAREFFANHGVRLSLTTAYNPEANGKVERGHSPIVKALVKACDGRAREWPKLLPYALWADRTTHSSVTGYLPIELMMGQKQIMPTESMICSWSTLPWKEEMNREDLLALRIRQLERRYEDVEVAVKRQREARLRNKTRFDKTHRIRPKKIEEGDWVLVYDSSLDHQHSSIRKFSKRWFGPYLVRTVYANGTYRLSELDGTILRVPIAGKRIKIFKKRQDQEPMEYLDEDQNEEEKEASEAQDSESEEQSGSED